MKRALIRVARGVLVLFMAYAIGRGIVELLTIQWSDPTSYREDWGGPLLLGVLLVHCGPGAVSAAFLFTRWRGRLRRAANG